MAAIDRVAAYQGWLLREVPLYTTNRPWKADTKHVYVVDIIPLTGLFHRCMKYYSIIAFLLASLSTEESSYSSESTAIT